MEIFSIGLFPLVFLAITAFVASTVAGLTGFGGAAILSPVLVVVFGVRDAIPILSVAQLIGNASRVGFNRKEVVWPRSAGLVQGFGKENLMPLFSISPE